MNNYLIGQLVTVVGSFKDGLTGALADPTAVEIRWGENPFNAVEWTYGSGTQVVKDSTGMYHAEIDTTGLSEGTWYYLFEGTGNVQAVGFSAFILESPPV